MGFLDVFKKNEEQLYTLNSPCSGSVCLLQDVNDPVFSSESMGKGVAIKNNADHLTIYAPIDGTISVMFPTGHAIGIKTKKGIEVLIHIGIDTVELNGKGFQKHIHAGDYIKKGQSLVDVDMAFLKSKGFDTTIMMVITNTKDFSDIICQYGDKTNEDEIIKVVK